MARFWSPGPLVLSAFISQKYFLIVEMKSLGLIISTIITMSTSSMDVCNSLKVAMGSVL